MSLSSLPNELLLTIGECLERPSDIFNFLRTNIRLYTLLKPVLKRFICSDKEVLITALHWAVACGNKEMMLGLFRESRRFNSFRIVGKRSHSLELFVSRGPAVSNPLPYKRRPGVRGEKLFQWVRGQGPQLKFTTDNFGGAAIEWAVKVKNRPLLTLLLQPKDGLDTLCADVLATCQETLEKTILVLKDVEGARFFLDVAGRLGVYSRERWEGLFISATVTCSKEMVHMLLEKGADINKPNTKGETPFFLSLCGGRKGMARLLMNHGANIFISPKDSGTTLHAAARVGNVEIAKILIQKGADINSRAGLKDLGGTALHLAATNGRFGVVKLLLSSGADVKKRNFSREKAVHVAKNERMEDLLRDQEGFRKVAIECKTLFRSVFKGDKGVRKS